MRRLICAFVVCKWHKQVFSWHGSFYYRYSSYQSKWVKKQSYWLVACQTVVRVISGPRWGNCLLRSISRLCLSFLAIVWKVSNISDCDSDFGKEVHQFHFFIEKNALLKMMCILFFFLRWGRGPKVGTYFVSECTKIAALQQCQFVPTIYAPNFEEVDGILVLGCPCVRQVPCMLGFWNFIYGFLMKK